MLTEDDCRAEIETLHGFFVRWYRGEPGRDRFARVERALAPGFERLTPEGSIAGRETVLASVREGYDTYDPDSCEIEIRNVTPVEVREDRALVRYEEWQTMDGETTGRLSTALFGPSDPEQGTASGVEWRYLQETWLDNGG